MAATAGKPFYGQLVIGPPGSGKTTYCFHIAELLKSVFNRKLAIINLDPANEKLPFAADVDVKELVSVEDAMELENLGPNGALMFAVEQMERDVDWLISRISALRDTHYFLFDCPGQIELYTHHKSFERICQLLIKKFDFRLAAVHLVDAYYCSDPAMFISVVLTALSAMMRLALPHVNVLSKIDLVHKLGKLDFILDYYTDVMDMEHLVARLDDEPFGRKYAKLSKAISEVVQGYSLVSFVPIAVQDRESLYNLVKMLDKAVGYSMSELEERQVRQTMANLPANAGEFDYGLISNMEEKYIYAQDDDFPED
ncbi:GPN-loop GTPase 2-like [Paramacrobiotus metropolitanus]|uniref:GPN-loop GTPase 2-like n=1 Tax=Paramacrobiotus metropolitanus TaxID=2943436 RepID=UPI0024456733|nr:GPN-loop GTPase 2-like [Paramacrobiotus metropolitanus]